MTIIAGCQSKLFACKRTQGKNGEKENDGSKEEIMRVKIT